MHNHIAILVLSKGTFSVSSLHSTELAPHSRGLPEFPAGETDENQYASPDALHILVVASHTESAPLQGFLRGFCR